MRLYVASLVLGLGWTQVVAAQFGRGPKPHIFLLPLHQLRPAPSALGQIGAKADDIPAHQEKAREYLQARKPALAIPEFAAIVAADPNNLDAQANLGVLLYFTGRSHDAEPHLRTALSLDPGQSKLQALLGFCEHRDRELEHARTDLSDAFPRLQEPKIKRQAGLEIVEIDTAMNDLPSAAVVIDQLKAAEPTDPEVLYAAYRVHMDLSTEALLDLSVAAPDSAQMHQAMAHELIRERDSTGAITNFRAALKADPNLPGGHLELAEALYASSDPAQKAAAEQEYRLAIQQNPGDVTALARLGDIAAEKEDHATAMEHYSQALSIQPDEADAAIGLAHELTETGKPDAALPLLLQVVKANPTNVVAHYRLSALYRRLHRPDDAKREIAEYERLKAMKENLHTIYQALRLETPTENDVKP